MLAGCTNGGIDLVSPRTSSRAVASGSNITLDVSMDIDVLNYAYALEQLEAAFYVGVVTNAAFASIFASVNFADRTSVLQTARTFEDLGVSAYNGAAKYIANSTYLGIAGKIVSVEARHAAAIRDLLAPRGSTFAPKAFDDANTPQTVLTPAQLPAQDRVSGSGILQSRCGGKRAYPRSRPDDLPDNSGARECARQLPARCAWCRGATQADVRFQRWQWVWYGPFADVFTNYNTFKAVAQAFEDTGYKGQAPTVQPNKAYLEAALTIHSVEARHACEVRRLRGNFQDNEPNEGWITQDMTDIPGTAAVYAGEANTVHGGVDAAAVTSVSAKEVTEAFDEPLTMAEVLAIVDPFIV